MISLSEHNMSSYWSVSLLSSGPNRGLRAALRTHAAALTAYLTFFLILMAEEGRGRQSVVPPLGLTEMSSPLLSCVLED